jgi:hypothetical protein
VSELSNKLEIESVTRKNIIDETDTLRERLIGALQKASLKIKDLEQKVVELTAKNEESRE